MATAPTVDENGISVPQYSDILTFMKTQYRAIHGDDAYLESDSQDGQFLAIVAAAINDCNAAAVAIYNSFSPATAQGQWVIEQRQNKRHCTPLSEQQHCACHGRRDGRDHDQ